MKIIITGIKSTDKYKLATKLVEINDSFSIGSKFTTKEKIDKGYEYRLDIKTISLAYKNNSLLFLHYTPEEIYGMTTDEFENNNVFMIDMFDFNMISQKVFNDNEILAVWLDERASEPSDDQKYEVKYLEERLGCVPYLYFLDEPVETMAKAVISYVNSNFENRQKILENYS